MMFFLKFLRKIKKRMLMCRIAILLKIRSRKGYYAVNINTVDMGLGARIIAALEILLYCDRHGFQPLLKFGYCEKKKQQTDYFRKLFNYKNINKNIPDDIHYTSIYDCSYLPGKKENDLALAAVTLNDAKQLFDKYLLFNPEITDEVLQFTEKWFTGKRVLGIHYRGTDKVNEATSVSFNQLLHATQEILDNDDPFDLIFISTDDTRIIEQLKIADIQIPVVCREDIFRTDTGVRFHLGADNSKEVIHYEAIVNCLILSHCDFLLKTASLLSDCSMIFNPSLPAVILNTPYENRLWWPTTEIIKKYSTFPNIVRK